MSAELFNKVIELMKVITDLQPELNMHFASLLQFLLAHR